MNGGLGTESMARWAARRPWRMIGIWGAALAAALILISQLFGGALTTEFHDASRPEAKQAEDLIKQRLNTTDKAYEMVIVRSATLTVDDPEYRSHVERLLASLMGLGDTAVKGAATYYMTGDRTLVSSDGHSTIIPVMMASEAERMMDKVYAVADGATDESFQVYVTGNASFMADGMKVAEQTLKTGETIGISVALFILALVFGAIAAAVLPVALGIAAVIGALGLAALVGQIVELSTFVTNMVTMMGLAVGIDYSLFVVTRYREERKRGKEKVEAIAAAGATASRAVLFSGSIVILALATMTMLPYNMFQTMGIGSILVVFVAVLATLTLLPAILSMLGDKVNAIRLPLLQRRPGKSPDSGDGDIWRRIAGVVTRRPVVSLAASVVLLGAAAMPYFDRQMGSSGVAGLPDYLRSKQGFMVLQEEFGYGSDERARVVVDGATGSQATQSAIAALKLRLAADPAFPMLDVQTYPQADLSILAVRVAGDPLGKQAMDAVSRLRATYIPEAFGDDRAQVLVTGQTAYVLDGLRTTDKYTPLVFAFVLSLSFLLLMLAFRSIVVPATAIAMNLLSVGAAYGLMVLVFQKGIGASLFGFQRVEVLESWLPIMLFAVLFGLSMDYHVFLLSRIRERFKQSGDNADAVSFGLGSTGRLITGAALIMVAVFFGFALGDMTMFQQMGFGLSVAVLLDATIVRCVLVPATMKLLGKHNWYLPRWLEWLPDISLGENAAAESRAISRQDAPGMMSGPAPDLVAVPVEKESSRESDSSWA